MIHTVAKILVGITCCIATTLNRILLSILTDNNNRTTSRHKTTTSTWTLCKINQLTYFTAYINSINNERSDNCCSYTTTTTLHINRIITYTSIHIKEAETNSHHRTTELNYILNLVCKTSSSRSSNST